MLSFWALALGTAMAQPWVLETSHGTTRAIAQASEADVQKIAGKAEAKAAGVLQGWEKPPGMVPLGVYWPWERTEPLARFCRMEKWKFVDRALGLLARNRINTVWVVNFPIAELAPMLAACHRHGVYLLPGFGEIHYDIEWRHSNWEYFAQQLARIKAEVKRSGAAAEHLLGYILCDEPRPQVMDGIEELRQRFAEIDPLRPAFTVTTWGATQTAIEKTHQPVVCVDLYPFFGPNDPNGPHTPEASRNYYTSNLVRFADMLRGQDRALWAMFQCYCEVWGPWRYDERHRQVALPGSYLHWVTPSPAQIRWQVWEAVRCGARGLICFLALPQPPDPESQNKPPPDVQWKEVLLKSETVAGPAALLNPDLTVTEQLAALGQEYGALSKLSRVILSWQPAREKGLRVAGAAVGVFRDARSDARYVVLVNNDFDSVASVDVLLPAGVRELKSAVSGEQVPVSVRQGVARAVLSLA
ncbi:MAG: hypothetical protein H5T86_15300, partial [Armatimonadetes bacterium]|nr:hypothetical protein [Armatimonadota bacterium]